MRKNISEMTLEELKELRLFYSKSFSHAVQVGDVYSDDKGYNRILKELDDKVKELEGEQGDG